MTKIIIFQASFVVSGIMCFESCGNTIHGFLNHCISDCIKEKILPSDARLMVDAEPNGLGIHKLILSIDSEQDDFIPIEHFHSILSARIKEDIVFDIIDNSEEEHRNKFSAVNWINILINLLSMGATVIFVMIFPPSILLTVGLTTLTFLTTAFTSREYLLAFFRNLWTKNIANMATTISLGLFLCLAHTLFHAVTMPLATSFSMIFMSFIMPMLLITFINGMDEIKRLVLEKSKQIQLKGIKTLFPKMSEKYRCYQLSQNESVLVSNIINRVFETCETENESISFIKKILDTHEVREDQKNSLKEGMLIEVKQGECFPVDCILVQGDTVIDASLLTGESQQNSRLWQNVPAGAINLGQAVTVYAVKSPYNSTVNSLLFRSNRARNPVVSEPVIPKFTYLYTILVLMGIIVAVLAPAAFGVATLSLVMQNVIGILFSICPCTIAIALQLPKLISTYQRSSKNIHLRDVSLVESDADEIEIIVFDKTGTLTTSTSVVESFDSALDSSVWQRVYLLEKAHGREHPLAKAIQTHYETHSQGQPLFTDVEECTRDEKNRGLTARVQGKTLHIGSFDYLQRNQIPLPALNQSKIEQGFSAVCVAEEGEYKGTIYIKHQARHGVQDALTRLKNEGKKIIMLTGDILLSARGFNKQINSVFNEEDIHAKKDPREKELFLKELMNTAGVNPKKVWFVGDGLNDAPCCRIVSEMGGVSCAMDSNDKSVFFTDISLNGSFDYLFKHKKLNHSLQDNIAQNKGILIYSTIAFLAFIISFSIAGIAVSPLIPMGIMLSTTSFVLFNSYRTQLAIDIALDKDIGWPKRLLSSNLSIGLLLGASFLLIVSVLVATITTGGLALPVIAFTTGAATAFSSVCTLSAMGLFSAFLMLLTASLLSEKSNPLGNEPILNVSEQPRNSSLSVSVSEGLTISERKSYGSLFVASPVSPLFDLDADRSLGIGISSIKV